MRDNLFHLRRLLAWTVGALVLLLVFEPPLWCDSGVGLFDEFRCLLPDGTIPELSAVPLLRPGPSIVLEAALMLVCTMVIRYEKRFFDRFGSKRPSTAFPEVFLVILAVMWVDLVVYLVLRQKSFRFAPYGRLALLFYWKETQRVFGSAVHCLKEFTNLVIFVLGSVWFFAWLLLMILDDTDEVRPPGFETFGDASKTLFSMAAGANFPDGMDDLVRRHAAFGFIFYLYMALTFVLFMNLMLAVVYNSYLENMKMVLKGFLEQRHKALLEIFVLLAEADWDPEKSGPLSAQCTLDDLRISHVVFEEFIDVLSTFSGFKSQVKRNYAEIFLKMLDDDQNDELDLKEFMLTLDILHYKIWILPERSLLMRRVDANFNASSCFVKSLLAVYNFVTTGKLTLITNIVLTLNFFFMLLESHYDMSKLEMPSYLDNLETFFSSIYVVEVLLTVSVVSMRSYLSHTENVFDCVVSWLLFFAGMEKALVSSYQLNLVRYLNILRMFRMMKFMGRVPQFKKMCSCVARLFEVSHEMMLMFLMSDAFFALVGMHAFGGLLYATNPVLTDSDYLAAGYDVLNFNDFIGSLGTLFSMVINEYMPELEGALSLVTFHPAGLVYCSMVLFMMVNISFNIFTAFTIDVFVSLDAAEFDRTSSVYDARMAQMKASLSSHQRILLHAEMPTHVKYLMTLALDIDGLDDAKQEFTQKVDKRLFQRGCREGSKPSLADNFAF
uniref:Ion transport domain-containing protein n=1 Tax=Noctiluca scintillans TaxID=2966 RepID=A0A7S1AKL4_NOCSC|mmetsp:Transcript_50135/g.133174  ORF Transcript_50135/g.133174 Transcript_50135/m.133174 type:complete len:723 (+) Transcript_50135:1-2169(+)